MQTETLDFILKLSGNINRRLQSRNIIVIKSKRSLKTSTTTKKDREQEGKYLKSHKNGIICQKKFIAAKSPISMRMQLTRSWVCLCVCFFLKIFAFFSHWRNQSATHKNRTEPQPAKKNELL